MNVKTFTLDAKSELVEAFSQGLSMLVVKYCEQCGSALENSRVAIRDPARILVMMFDEIYQFRSNREA